MVFSTWNPNPPASNAGRHLPWSPGNGPELRYWMSRSENATFHQCVRGAGGEERGILCRLRVHTEFESVGDGRDPQTSANVLVVAHIAIYNARWPIPRRHFAIVCAHITIGRAIYAHNLGSSRKVQRNSDVSRTGLTDGQIQLKMYTFPRCGRETKRIRGIQGMIKAETPTSQVPF